ncbi:MAG: UDP-N-acetylmuramoyl-L-alanyl-D-glutamate--2,6-diaminopimelate ligase [Chlamydiae bacterium]|nr:UDP-N-acetylmuramoyl-L-alanyl-D-glutamate--2,6-diaminopimelate ligase [Chlamydiota bacterium]
MMRLKRLIHSFPDLIVKGSKEIEITGICSDSRLVASGNLFVATRGQRYDGNLFIPDAIAAGASAILTDMFDPFCSAVQLIHPNVPDATAKLCAEYFQHPSKKLPVIGVTGTNGKTTSCYLIKALLDGAGKQTGLIGTVEWIVGHHRSRQPLTTPDVITNHKLLKEMVNAGCKAAVMEVSSHALDQNRTGEIDFDIALFTNFSQDHLDYHSGMEEYRKAKERLFSGLGEGRTAILNYDDEARSHFIASTKARLITYGLNEGADLLAKDLTLTDQGIQFTCCHKKEEVLCRSPLIGRFNVYNLLAALSVGVAMDLPLALSSELLKNFHQIPGRMERVENRQGLHIFVDYAHTEDALRSVLRTLCPLKQGKLITVFGCGGDRDVDKRKKMGMVASQFSDISIVTSDNPRGEDPQAIIDQILQGVLPSAKVEVALNRKEAIRMAIFQACPEDMILIAGKGHETQQVYSDQIFPFDDAKVAAEICNEKERSCL